MSLPIRKADSIRVAAADDADEIAAIYAPVVRGTFISFEIEAPTAAEMRQRIDRTLDTLPWLVSLDATGRIDGYAYASRHRERPAYQWSIDVSAYVRDDSRRRGVGGRLYGVLLDDLRALGYAQAFAGIALPNEASVRLHESVGFRPIGIYRSVGYKLGSWRDVGWWQRELGCPPQPAPPRPFDRGRRLAE